MMGNVLGSVNKIKRGENRWEELGSHEAGLKSRDSREKESLVIEKKELDTRGEEGLETEVAAPCADGEEERDGQDKKPNESYEGLDGAEFGRDGEQPERVEQEAQAEGEPEGVGPDGQKPLSNGDEGSDGEERGSDGEERCSDEEDQGIDEVERRPLRKSSLRDLTPPSAIKRSEFSSQ